MKRTKADIKKEIEKIKKEELAFHKPYFEKSHYDEKNWESIILRDLEEQNINYRLLKAELLGFQECEEEELIFLKEAYKLLPFSHGIKMIEKRIKLLSQLEDDEVKEK